MRILLFVVLLMCCTLLKGQNLIPNGELDGGSGADFFTMWNWNRFEGTPDAYTPANNWGSETTTNNTEPHSGTGYVGFYQYGYWGGLDWYEREYIIGQTESPLDSGKVYQMEYWVKPVLADDFGISYAIDQIGALFTAEVPEHDEQNIFPFTPQVDNGGTLLNDLSGWTRISDCFIAEGGEQYVTIGNFQRDEETNAQGLPGATQPSLAYYLLDAVSLVEADYPQLPNDTSLCAGDSFDVILEHPTASYLWNDGSTSNVHIFDQIGTHFVDITIGGCTKREEIVISAYPSPIPTVHEVELCFGEPVVLGADSRFDLMWSTGEVTETIVVEQEGLYWVEQSNICGTVTDEFHVMGKDCSCQLWVPNTFTPNNDGVNDVFEAQLDCDLIDYRLQIYDRWGRLVFESSDPNESWSGGGDSPYYLQDGTYQWVIEYRSRDIAVNDNREVGTVTIVR